MTEKIPVQSLIDHIKTAVDVDPWAQQMAETLLKKHIPVEYEMEGDGRTPFWYWVCGECHGQIDSNDLYCRHCGQVIKNNCIKETEK